MFVLYLSLFLQRPVFRTGGRVTFLSATRKSPKKRVCRRLSGGTHCAPSSLRSNSRRKYEVLPHDTPVVSWCVEKILNFIFIVFFFVNLIDLIIKLISSVKEGIQFCINIFIY
ncbi:hypothetical protein, partial [Comamonas jiangduensis]|uniref:hypothetical protein n=1 Tax=Comamonas jiangduensis TaxID=1194168 RepID=UPI003BF7A5FC